jgi:hypothetical protein
MKNIKPVLSTDNLCNSISLYVSYALIAYSEGKDWKCYVRMSNALLRTITLEGFKSGADFSKAWDELIRITGFNRLHTNMEISDYLNSL